MRSTVVIRSLCLLGVVLTLVYVALYYRKMESIDLESIADYADGDLVRANLKSGFYDTDIEIELDKAPFMPGDAYILYTLDGNNPIHYGEKYVGKIPVTASTETINVVTLRAVLYYRGEYSEIFDWTYFVGTQVYDRYHVPVLSIVTDYNNLFDEETGIFVPGITYQNYLRDGGDPEMDITLVPCNYNQRGEKWIRSAHIELYDTDGTHMAGQNIGLAVSGSSSSGYQLKSLKLIAHEKYDPENPRFTGEFWREYEDASPWNHVEKFNKILLKSGGQDSQDTQLRWNVIGRLAEEAGLYPVAGSRRVLVYINGSYYGLLTAAEHYSAYNLASECGLENNDLVEVIKGSEEECLAEVKELFLADLNDEDNRKKLEEKVDMEQYLLYCAIQVMLNNIDWPKNNYGVWRYTGEEEAGNAWSDGRYRFLLYDVDLAWLPEGHWRKDLFGAEILDKLLNEERSASPMFMNVINSGYYRQKFLFVVAELSSSVFSPGHVAEVFEEEKNVFCTELDYMEPTVYNRGESGWLSGFAAGWQKRTDAVSAAAQDRVSQVGMALENHWGIDLEEVMLRWNEQNEGITDIKADGVVINEIYAKGSEDWIEVYNGTDGEIHLREFCLSDSEKNLYKFTCPDVVLPSGKFIVINGKSSTDLGGYLCNFNIRRGETIFLVNGITGEIRDSVAVPAMSANESYGRFMEGEKWYYFNSPTKGTENVP